MATGEIASAPNAWLVALDARRDDVDAEPLGLEPVSAGRLVPAMNYGAWRALSVYHRRLGTVRTTSLVARLAGLLVLA